MSKYLAIDYGKKNVGLAISDKDKLFSFPYKVVGNDIFLNVLDNIITQENIEKVILGHPKKLNNTNTHITEEVENLFELLKNRYQKIEFILYDERFTSTIAKQVLANSNYKRKKRRDKTLLDIKSAEILLNDYLIYESNNNITYDGSLISTKDSIR